MAKILGRKRNPVAPTSADAARGRAFEMYMTLDKNLQPLYKLKEIAKAVGMEKKNLSNIIHYYRWPALREEAMLQGLEAANEKMYRLRAENRQETARREALSKSIANIADLITELRSYNKLNYDLLMSKALPRKKHETEEEYIHRKTKYLSLIAPEKALLYMPSSRSELHRAYLDTLRALTDIFGPTQIKMCAGEMLYKLALEDRDRASKVLDSNAKNEEEEPAAAVEEMGAAEYEEALTAARKGAIDGPKNYTGLKETSVVEGVEDAIIAKPGGTDSES